ncbi:14 kDa phosphohistidine phosphatase isoform X1 [Prionailurus bengalensis]|uniref:14 kDa phosphohistidine phosphatase isoform X1 n=1 Tax=Prionailurus bengalensis TaxID=37029 RepID=UPI001CA8E714|nr:14 kDa phosphohistidine phosphatase isoform X1 [Prionailurus bengalensis]
MAAADLAQIADVDIDPDGVFKYVLIRVHAAPPSEAPAGKSKEIVRGYKWAEYHADIYDKVSGDLQKKGYSCECLGGGRISHQSQDKKIHVYGYSMDRLRPGLEGPRARTAHLGGQLTLGGRGGLATSGSSGPPP